MNSCQYSVNLNMTIKGMLSICEKHDMLFHVQCNHVNCNI